MAHLRPRPTRPASPNTAPRPHQKKTPALSDTFEALFSRARPAFTEQSVYDRALVLALASIVSLGRRTIAATLTACGRQFEDWTAAYRLFERQRFDPKALFAVPQSAILETLPNGAPLVVVLDDTQLPKRGKKVAEAAWHHDPLGPPFAHQIQWSQRLLQISAMLPSTPANPHCSARAVPIDQVLQATIKKPSKKATDAEKKTITEKRLANATPCLAAKHLLQLRTAMDDANHEARPLLVAFDGGYTNKALFKANLPRTALIGRIRKDAKLFAPPAQGSATAGRPRLYGERLQTPAELLADDTIAWQKASAFGAGKVREFEYKTIDRCRWQSAGGRDLRAIVIRPLSRTPHEAGRRLFFAHPGFLLCTDPTLPIKTALQAYLWRWEIEVGFQDQKTHLGLGEAQTYTRPAVANVLHFQAFVYALLLLAAHQTELTTPPRPKWQKPTQPEGRVTIRQLQSIMRGDLWGRALGIENKTHFATLKQPESKPPKIKNTLASAVIYAAQ